REGRGRRLAGEQPADPVDGAAAGVAGPVRRRGDAGASGKITTPHVLPAVPARPAAGGPVPGRHAPRPGAARRPGVAARARPAPRAGPGAGGGRRRLRLPRAERRPCGAGAAVQYLPGRVDVRRRAGSVLTATGLSMTDHPVTVIVGAGLAGALFACYLGRA